MPGVPPGRRVLEFGPCDGFILMSSFAAVPDAASLCVVPYSTRTETTWETRSGPIIFIHAPSAPLRARAVLLASAKPKVADSHSPPADSHDQYAAAEKATEASEECGQGEES
jgi:hypothetical protein